MGEDVEYVYSKPKPKKKKPLKKIFLLLIALVAITAVALLVLSFADEYGLGISLFGSSTDNFEIQIAEYDSLTGRVLLSIKNIGTETIYGLDMSIDINGDSQGIPCSDVEIYEGHAETCSFTATEGAVDCSSTNTVAIELENALSKTAPLFC